MPAPAIAKQFVLERHSIPDCTWIETGTWLGDTTAFLSEIAFQVWTIEPGHKLAVAASVRFQKSNNIKVIEGLSENMLDEILYKVSGNVCFWLDGHYSSGDAFKGPVDTPIRLELIIIEEHLSRLEKLPC